MAHARCVERIVAWSLVAGATVIRSMPPWELRTSGTGRRFWDPIQLDGAGDRVGVAVTLCTAVTSHRSTRLWCLLFWVCWSDAVANATGAGLRCDDCWWFIDNSTCGVNRSVVDVGRRRELTHRTYHGPSEQASTWRSEEEHKKRREEKKILLDFARSVCSRRIWFFCFESVKKDNKKMFLLHFLSIHHLCDRYAVMFLIVFSVHAPAAYTACSASNRHTKTKYERNTKI